MEQSAIAVACARLRREIADRVQTLDTDPPDSPSLCDRWTVREVAGHLTDLPVLDGDVHNPLGETPVSDSEPAAAILSTRMRR